MIPKENVGKLDALRGTAAHKLMELSFNNALADWRPQVDKLFANLPDKLRRVQTVLVYRAMLGWHRRRWPHIFKEYELMSSEGAWTWLLAPDVMMPLRMDGIMRSRHNGALAVLDFKFIGSMDLNWRERHSHSDQTQLYIQALKERSNELVEGIIYDAIIVGQWDHKKGIQKSPFVTAYDRGPDSGSVDMDRYSPSYVRGAPLVDISEWSDKRWMDWAINTGVLEELYITSGLLLPTSRNLLATKNATVVAQRIWDAKIAQLEQARMKYGADSEEYMQLFESTIERNPDACLQYGWEKKCEHYNACWIHPDDLTDYVPREDHHPLTNETNEGS